LRQRQAQDSLLLF